MIKKLNFTNEFFTAEYVKDDVVSLNHHNIVANLSTKPIPIDFVSQIQLDKSFFVTDKVGEVKVDEAIVIKYNFDPQLANLELQDFCIRNWDNNAGTRR